MVKRAKSYDSKFKAELALLALESSKSLAELGSTHQVPRTTIIEWRDKLIAEAGQIFISGYEKSKQVRCLEQEIETLHRLLGEMSVENSYLKKRLKK